jgi:phage major head subunit gpT-like protein
MGQYQSIEFNNLKGIFYNSYEQRAEGSYAQQVGQLFSGVNAEDAILSTIGGLRDMLKWDGERKTFSPEALKQTITNYVYEDNVTVPVDSYRRSGDALWSPRIGELGAIAQDHWMTLAATVLTDTTTLGFDGKVLFSASHPTAGGTSTGSNLLTNSDVGSLDVATAAAPTADEMSAVLVDVAFYFQTLKNSQDLYLNKGARSFTIVSSNPKIVSSAAGAIFRPNLTSGATSPAYNATEALGYKFNAYLDPTLGSATSAVFYMARNDTASKGVILIEDAPIEFQEVGPGSEYAKLQNKYLFGVKAVRGAGPGAWQSVVKCTLS